MHTSGVVLAGGRSSRMGSPKSALDWHGCTLLYRTAAVLARVVDGPVVVVRAPAQALPDLPTGVDTVEDPVAGLGPMQGLAAGLGAVAGAGAGVAFACSTDLPFLHPAFIARTLALLLAEPDADAVMPVVGGHRQPLAAAYRTALAPLLTGLLAEGDLRPKMLLRHCRVALPSEAELLADPELRRLDPELVSVRGVDTPEEYAAARAVPPPSVLVTGPDGGTWETAAATLGAAVAPGGGTVGRATRVTINHHPVPDDPRQPLVAGDRVTFRPAATTSPRAIHPGRPRGRSTA
jgi:molybdopterin-guanine dinucleotide biosynthesis protein A